jgi:uncharacterized protein (DUF1800 family)
MLRTPSSGPDAARIAAHRFGLGEASLVVVGNDAAGWLQAQIGPAEPQRGAALATLADGVRSHAEFAQQRRQRKSPDTMVDLRSGEQQFGDHFRAIVQADVRAQLATAATTQQPFTERLALFWANHFTVSVAKASARGLVGAFEREAIRPHIAGPYEVLLKAAVTHGAMLRYLDNDQSAGPHSKLVLRLARRPRDDDTPGPRITGLNENLAREVLELHTLGAASKAYTQADVTAFAAVLTGWRVPLRSVLDGSLALGEPVARFDPAWHEPGPKRVLGRSYQEGPQALDALLHDLAQHPATAQFLALKLARHFVADDPPPALTERLAQAYRRSGGELGVVYRELVAAPEAWDGAARKLKTPAEFVVSTSRLLGLGEQAFVRNADAGVSILGQRVQAAPSPAGWPDQADEWLGPDALWKRVEWATRVADRVGRQTDARALARASFGPGLSEATALQIERAADGPQALALLLLSPEFQRR